MLLFDIIRDWFVMYIWGGITSTGEEHWCFLGYYYSADSGGGSLNTLNTFLPVRLYENDYETWIDNICFGDWLSTTSTIIVMILLCVVFGLMVRWLFRLTAGLLRGN